jgi:murein DD-endopeptidase MepM/ murein hydrolase activator NlpD
MKRIQGSLALILLALMAVACSPAAASTHTPGPTASQAAFRAAPTVTIQPPTPTPTPPPAATTAPTSTQGEPRFTPTDTACDSDVCLLDPGFPLARPIAPPGRVTVDASYRFGSTQEGQREPHHGVEFLNSTGTPVLAAAEGLVLVAGDDLSQRYGPYYNFYGNLVVLEHHLAGSPHTAYTLYGHLSEVSVGQGDRVLAGEQVGLVGLSGAATGSHLHFEVRWGENDYWAARNPELWLAPLADGDGRLTGAIAGRVLDESGAELSVDNVVIEPLTPGAAGKIYLTAYQDKRLIGQPPWEESFAAGDLPPGTYRVTFVRAGIQQRQVQVQPGKLTLVTFRIWSGERE